MRLFGWAGPARRRRGRGAGRRMEDKKEEGEAEIQEHGPEHWFSKWERQCLAEAEQEEALAPELHDEAAAQPEHKQQKLWHLFQNSATAVAQLYKGERHRGWGGRGGLRAWGRRGRRGPARGWRCGAAAPQRGCGGETARAGGGAGFRPGGSAPVHGGGRENKMA